MTAMWINENEISPYLRDVRKIKVLTPAEEDVLINKFQSGDDRAMNDLIVANLRFVITVAKEYQNQGLDIKDLIAEGNFGLVKAAQGFDGTRGVRFYSYAVWWVRQSIRQALNEHARTVRLPVNVISDMNTNKKEMSEKEYNNWCAKKGVNRTQSLNQVYGEDGEEMIQLLGGGENDAFKTANDYVIELPTVLNEVMDILCSREREIVTLYYGLNDSALTLQEIAQHFGLTKERVRQIKNQAIKKLRFNAPMLFKFFHD